MCSLRITQFEDRPKVLLIKWIHREHKDKHGAICHGVHDPIAYEENSDIAPKISVRSRSYIERMLRLGISTRAIIRAHMAEIMTKYRHDHPDEDGDARWSRDMQLCPKDIASMREALHRQKPDHTNDDTTIIMIWVHENPKNILLYQPCKKEIQQPSYLM